MDSQPTLSHVFISYAREDQPYTRKLAEGLRQRGFEVWMDDRIDFGDRWWQTIVQAIRASAAIVVVMTPDSEQSEWVEREILLAQHERKPIFPLLLRGHGIPLLVTTHYANVTGGWMPPDDFYERLEREVRPQRDEEVVAPVAPEPTVHKERVWSWQQLRLPLAVVALLAIGLLVGVVASGLIGGVGQPTVSPTPSVPALVAQPNRTPMVTTMPTPTAPYTPESTVTRTDTPMPTDTPTLVPTDTPTPVPPTATPTHTRTPAPPTDTPTPTRRPTPTPIPGLDIGSTQIRPTDGATMVFVPAGEFIMGSPEGEGVPDEYPQHTVYLDAFWIDQTPVTNAQYRKCVDAGACTPSACADDPAVSRDTQPVVCVDWHQAAAYAKWVGGRLPTEAEWEKAARGTDGREYPWGDDRFEASKLSFCLDKATLGYQPIDVASYPAEASPYGALDMAINVQEWISDWYEESYYEYSSYDNPTGPEMGETRILRGAACAGYGGATSAMSTARCAERSRHPPDTRNTAIGFRLAMPP